uniref:EKC/KEOPS complex subunit CGI121 n=1 Tax=Clastoptera arizonana TaxID=38151 RepID=A0A1B6C578_9HEMI
MKVRQFNLECNKVIQFALMSDVKNIKGIRESVLNQTLKCAIVKANLIVDVFQLLIAANKAVISQALGKLTSKTLYTEVLFNLSLSKNISQSLVKFGIDDSVTDVIVILIGENKSDLKMDNILSVIDGYHQDFSQLLKYTNIKLVKQIYKICDLELTKSTLLDLIISKIAFKDITS